MYNRYIPNGTRYEPIPGDNASRSADQKAHRPPPPPPSGGADPLGRAFGKLGGLLKNIHPDSLDSGDILLLLILILLLLDGDDDLELIITLGLLLLFGLFGGESPRED